MVFLASLLEGGVFIYGHPGAEKQMPPRKKLATSRQPQTLQSLLRPMAQRFCCGSLQFIQIPSAFKFPAENALFNASKHEADQARRGTPARAGSSSRGCNLHAEPYDKAGFSHFQQHLHFNSIFNVHLLPMLFSASFSSWDLSESTSVSICFHIVDEMMQFTSCNPFWRQPDQTAQPEG